MRSKNFSSIALEGSGPRNGRGYPVLICVLVEIEGVHVVHQWQVLLVDHGRGDRVLRHWPYGEECYKAPSGIPGLADTADQVRGEGVIEISRISNDLNIELGFGCPVRRSLGISRAQHNIGDWR